MDAAGEGRGVRGACRGCRVWHFRQLEISPGSPGSLGSRLTFDLDVVFDFNSFFRFAIDSCSALGLAEQEKQAAGSGDAAVSQLAAA